MDVPTFIPRPRLRTPKPGAVLSAVNCVACGSLSDLQVYPLWTHPATRVAGCMQVVRTCRLGGCCPGDTEGAPHHRRVPQAVRFPTAASTDSGQMWILPTRR